MNVKKLFPLLLSLTIFFASCSSNNTNLTENEKQTLHDKRIYELQRVKERLSKEY